MQKRVHQSGKRRKEKGIGMDRFYLEKQVVGIYAENCYIVADLETKECIVIDPGADFGRIFSRVREKDLKVKYILLTHGHFDHIGAVTELQNATGAPVCINFGDEELYQAAIKPSEEILDGAEYTVGAFRLKVIATPGHTQGGVCFYIEEKGILFAGDTLFYRSVGRTDLLGGNHRQLIKGIIEKLMVLPDETVVYPGHGMRTTIGEERRHNLFIQG